MKVLPIKLSDALYNDLSYLSKQTATPMAAIIRNYFAQPVIKKSAQIRKQATQKNKTGEKLTWHEHISKFSYDGPDHSGGLTDDEILYGGKLGDY